MSRRSLKFEDGEDGRWKIWNAQKMCRPITARKYDKTSNQDTCMHTVIVDHSPVCSNWFTCIECIVQVKVRKSICYDHKKCIGQSVRLRLQNPLPCISTPARNAVTFIDATLGRKQHVTLPKLQLVCTQGYYYIQPTSGYDLWEIELSHHISFSSASAVPGRSVVASACVLHILSTATPIALFNGRTTM